MILQDFYEYQFNARRTFAELDSRKLEAAHMVMGMCGEIDELYAAIEKNDPVNIGEELTDIQWFLANYLFGKPCFDVFYDLVYQGELDEELKDDLHSDPLCGLVRCISKLTDIAKKDIVYGKTPKGSEFVTTVLLIMKHSLQLYSKYGLDVKQCFDNNIAKLKIRFPEKFTQEAAVNRNLEAERAELEK